MKDHPLLQYHYEISEKNIGKIPANPRDHARLFVYNTQTDEIHFDYFYHLAKYLPSHALMVLNNTGVIPARVIFTKDTGGKVEGLFLYNEGVEADGSFPIIVNKQILVGRKLFIDKYEFDITRHEEQRFFIKPLFDINELPSILLNYGITPTPKYLGKLDMEETDLRERYQTIYSQENKSVAAPTASLHFTEDVFQSLDKKNIERTEITLHVGLGTFSDVSASNVSNKKLHTEPITISREAIQKIQTAKNNLTPIIGVGTTVVRSLESQYEAILHQNEPILDKTDIFIMPEYDFKILNHLITNFHIPKSSLMALVDAFLQHKKSKKNILELYQIALDEGYRFYSFGDSMLIL